MRYELLVQKCPRLCAVEVPHADACDVLRSGHAAVDRHSREFIRSKTQPVSGATTRPADVERQCLVTPDVGERGFGTALERDIGHVGVRPQPT